MIHYKLYLKNPASHYIYVDLTIDNIATNTLELQLPAWRPGRYELGNFAKNIKRVDAYDENETPLSFIKLTKDLWQITTNGATKVKVTYSYFTNEINAGNCFADATQLYVNPVHLCMYVPTKMNEAHTIELDVPDNYKIATSLQVTNKTLTASNYNELADSPFIASDKLQSDFFELSGVKFWLHFMGECKPDFIKIKNDFIKYTSAQLNFWGSFPVHEYHYLFQILPHRHYHGVEHQHSTVVALGPGYAINNGSTYEDLLGVSCHELFHTWNIKYIRPKEMLPYDFTKENYARTGFVYEGITTYYGDVFLFTSGVFTTNQYFNTLEERLTKHFHNYGRFNLSVANSSFDNWLDGYVPGAPYRKTSIYDEGNLIAFMLDVLIMQHTLNKKGLRDVCRILYNDFGKKQIGYTEQDILTICENVSGVLLNDFFDNFVYGTKNYEPQLQQCFDYLGWQFIKQPSNNLSESMFGFKTVEHGHLRKVSLIAPFAPSWDAGLSIGDEIVAVNNFGLKNDLNEWLTYFKNDTIVLTVISNQIIKQITLTNIQNTTTYFDTIKLKIDGDKNENFNFWIKLNS